MLGDTRDDRQFLTPLPPRNGEADARCGARARRSEARRKAAETNAIAHQKEFQGPKGPEPTRYGDWERKGIASDF